MTSESLGEFVERCAVDLRHRRRWMREALLRHAALVVTEASGRRILLISSPEMSHPEEGAHRVTILLHDGPQGHITRTSIADLAEDLARDLMPVRIEPADDHAVMAWTSTPAYIDGAQRVLEVQRLNRATVERPAP